MDNQFGEPPQVLCNGGERELVLCAKRATQSKPAELQDALQVREPHLDLLALTPRPLEGLGASKRSGNVSCTLMDVARNLARWLLRTAPGLEWAYIAVELAAPTSAWRMARDASTSTMTPNFTSMR